MRTPSGVATELRLWASSLESIANDIDRGIRQKGDDEFRYGDEGWVTHLTGRITNVELLLQDVRLDIHASLLESKEGGNGATDRATETG